MEPAVGMPEVVEGMRAGMRGALASCVACLCLAGCLEKIPAEDQPQGGTQPTPVAPASGGSQNTPPTISGTPAPSIMVGLSYLFQPTATDSDGDALSFTVTGLPAWASFDTSRGGIHGVPAAADAGVTADITISVSDGKVVTRLAPFHITVMPVPVPPGTIPPNNTAPTIRGVPEIRTQARTAWRFHPEAFDADSPILTFAVLNRPGWASFSTSTGELAGTPDATQAGVYPNIIISVSDGLLSASLPAFNLEVTPASNQPPVFTGTPVAAIAEGASYYFAPEARDPEGDTLTFTAVNLPGWASLVPGTGEIFSAPDAAPVGIYSNIILRVSDGTNTVSLPAFSITVSAAPATQPGDTGGPGTPPNQVPVIAGAPETTVIAGTAYAFTPAALDADAEPLTFSIANRPGWASFDTATGALTGTPNAAQVGTYSNIAITVSDGHDTATLQAFSITVAAAPNHAPVISGSPETAVTAGNSYSFTASASDADGQGLVFSIANRPAWASFNANTGTLSGTPGAQHAGSYGNIEISVSDGSASISLTPFTIIVLLPGAVTRMATLSWTAPTENDDNSPLTDLAGYRIYHGNTPTSLHRSVTIESPDITSAVIENLGAGTHYFAVSAFTSAGVESALSAIGSKSTP